MKMAVRVSEFARVYVGAAGKKKATPAYLTNFQRRVVLRIADV